MNARRIINYSADLLQTKGNINCSTLFVPQLPHNITQSNPPPPPPPPVALIIYSPATHSLEFFKECRKCISTFMETSLRIADGLFLLSPCQSGYCEYHQRSNNQPEPRPRELRRGLAWHFPRNAISHLSADRGGAGRGRR